MMERALKERILGAIVLVVVVVLVVPVFLDGPPGDDEMISEHVLLPGQSEQKSQMVVLERDREEPVPAQTGTEPQALETTPDETTLKEAPQSQPATVADQTVDAAPIDRETSAPEPDEPDPEAERPAASVQVAGSSTGMWAVQMGSFSSQENAETLAANLRKQGFAAFLSQLSGSTGQLHRVRIGPQKDRRAAEAMAARLKKAGHSGQVVPHP